MNAGEILRDRIASLEADKAKAEKKLEKLGSGGGLKAIDCIIEIEKIKFAINNIYICLGEIGR